jgi:hypothetical protein
MTELESSGRFSSGPNANTYAILLTFFERAPGASAIGYDIAKQMMTEHINNAKDEIISERNFKLNEECLNAAMRTFTNRLDVDSAEQLLRFSLSEFGGVQVFPDVLKMMLLLYKSENLQDKALSLMKTYIEVCRHGYCVHYITISSQSFLVVGK